MTTYTIAPLGIVVPDSSTSVWARRKTAWTEGSKRSTSSTSWRTSDGWACTCWKTSGRVERVIIVLPSRCTVVSRPASSNSPKKLSPQQLRSHVVTGSAPALLEDFLQVALHIPEALPDAAYRLGSVDA